MARYNITENKSWCNRMVRIAVVCASIILILWFMPRGAHQQLQYDLNTPWKSELLMAKHPFVINKTTDAIEKEKDSLRRSFQPYYKYAREETQKRVKALEGYLRRHDVDEDEILFLTERLSNIYTAGILDSAEYKQLMAETDKHIRYIEQGDTVSRRVSFTFTPTAAIELLLSNQRPTSNNTPQPKASNSQDSNLKSGTSIDSLNIALFVKPNLTYDEASSQHEMDSLLATVSPFTNDTIKEGQKIIDRGEMVDAEHAVILQSYIDELERQTSLEQRSTTFIGQLLFVVMMIVLYTFYLYLFRKDYFYNPQATMMLYSVITLFPVSVSLMMRNNILNVYLLPLSMVPIFVRVFMDSRTAFFTHIIMILLCSMAVGYHYEFIVIQLVAGLVAIYSLRELSSRSQLFKSALLVTAAAVLICFAIQLIQTDNIDKLGGYMYKYLIVSGILLLLSYPLMYVFEKLFGFTSDVSLFEISDTNRGALRELSEVAPGTFQHSITVGNLAAEIARRIGANALLVRTGALFHDIGKMANPLCFTENQAAGDNYHKDLPPEQSARDIIRHVQDGLHGEQVQIVQRVFLAVV